MQDKVMYEYAIIRFAPYVEREEFFNVGVILYCKSKKFLSLRYEINPHKLKAFGCEHSLEEIETYLKAWELICKGGKETSVIGQLEIADRFRWLVATRSTIIQSSKTHTGLCFDPEKELNSIFEKLVL